MPSCSKASIPAIRFRSTPSFGLTPSRKLSPSCNPARKPPLRNDLDLLEQYVHSASKLAPRLPARRAFFKAVSRVSDRSQARALTGLAPLQPPQAVFRDGFFFG